MCICEESAAVFPIARDGAEYRQACDAVTLRVTQPGLEQARSSTLDLAGDGCALITATPSDVVSSPVVARMVT